MRFAIQLVSVVALTMPSLAQAADCDQPYTTDQLLTDLEAVETAAQTGEPEGSITAADRMERGMGCLDEKLVPMLIGRTYRSIGAGFLVGGDTNSGQRWFRTAVEVDPGFEFGLEEYAVDDPVRTAYDAIRMGPSANPAAVEGMSLIEGKFFLDGRSLTEAAATRGRPHLLQLVGDDVQSWLIDGNSFPAAVLAGGAAPEAVADAGKPKKVKEPKVKKVKEPKVKKDKTAETDDAVADGPPPPPPTDSGGTRFGRQRPPEKTPLIIGGGAIIAGAGVMYGLAIVQRQKFDDVKDSEEDLRKAQLATNRLYLGSLGVLAVGAGTLTWGIVLDGSGSPLPAIRGRF